MLAVLNDCKPLKPDSIKQEYQHSSQKVISLKNAILEVLNDCYVPLIPVSIKQEYKHSSQEFNTVEHPKTELLVDRKPFQPVSIKYEYEEPRHEVSCLESKTTEFVKESKPVRSTLIKYECKNSVKEVNSTENSVSEPRIDSKPLNPASVKQEFKHSLQECDRKPMPAIREPYVRLVRLDNVDNAVVKTLHYLKKDNDLDSPEKHGSEELKKKFRPVDLTMYVCNTCNRCFTDPNLLDNHEHLHSHDVQQVKKSTCSKDFISKSSNDNITSEPLKCKVRKKGTKSKPAYAKTLMLDGMYRYICDHCPRSYTTVVALQRHMISHTGLHPYRCDQCKTPIKSRTELVNHCAKHMDPTIKKYICDCCNREYISRVGILQHKCVREVYRLSAENKTINDKLKNFICHICKHTFRERKTLVIHINSHGDIRQFECKYCQKMFSQKSHLNRHERVHTGFKPYTCKECGKGFHDKSNMKVHEITHSGARPFKCKVCNKGFTQISHLRTHSVAHIVERNYKCEVCGKAFKNKSNLKLHVLTHSDDKPFKCQECNRSFVQPTAFRRHKCLC